MPHIKLEHTENIDLSIITLLFKQLRINLMKNTGIKEENCKCKAILVPVYVVGSDDDSKHFYSLEISFLKGRSEETKKKIGQKSLQILQEYFMKNNIEDLSQFNVEIREIDPEDYFTSNIL